MMLEVVFIGVQKLEVLALHGGLLVGNMKIMLILEKDLALNSLLFLILPLIFIVKDHLILGLMEIF